MSNLEPIIPNIILEENDTLVHINLTIVISKGKIIIISTVVDRQPSQPAWKMQQKTFYLKSWCATQQCWCFDDKMAGEQGAIIKIF